MTLPNILIAIILAWFIFLAESGTERAILLIACFIFYGLQNIRDEIRKRNAIP